MFNFIFSTDHEFKNLNEFWIQPKLQDECRGQNHEYNLENITNKINYKIEFFINPTVNRKQIEFDTKGERH